jgi:SAM-dependent methyltransferase
LRWAIERLGLSGDEAILEIGCGRGVAVSLVCPLLQGGTITAIDRSATAIQAARERNEALAASGKAVFHEAPIAAIEEFDGKAGTFDVIFAVNVNLFWLDAERGLEAVRRLLAKDGRLFLFYEAPSPGQLAKIAITLPEKLAENGFEVVETDEVQRSNLIAVVARPTKR